MFKIFRNGLKIMVASSFILSSNFLLQHNKVLASDFLKSCNNVSINANILRASCRQPNGISVSTLLNLNGGLANIDGRLIWRQNGNFYASCNDLSYQVPGHSNVPILLAFCRKENGLSRGTAIDLNEKISNIDGQLRFDP